MSSDARTHPAHRARAVAEAPVQPLLARADELARRWAIALILALPLERIGEIPLESFAREAPDFLAHVLRALQSDAELARLAEPRSDARPDQAFSAGLGELPSARGGQAAVEAIEALRGVLWEALLDELGLPGFQSSPARQVADLADRLAYVCSVALGSTLARAPRVPDPEAAAGAAAEVTVRRQVPAAPLPAPVPGPELRERSDPDVTVEPPEHAARAALGEGVAIVDEAEPVLRRAARGPAPAAPQPASASAHHHRREPTVTGTGRVRARGRPRPWDIPLDGADEPDPPTGGPGGSAPERR